MAYWGIFHRESSLWTTVLFGTTLGEHSSGKVRIWNDIMSLYLTHELWRCRSDNTNKDSSVCPHQPSSVQNFILISLLDCFLSYVFKQRDGRQNLLLKSRWKRGYSWLSMKSNFKCITEKYWWHREDVWEVSGVCSISTAQAPSEQVTVVC